MRDYCFTVTAAGAGNDLVMMVDAWDVVLRGPEDALLQAYNTAVRGARCEGPCG